MNSKTIVAAFKAAGIRVRVRDFGLKFRICTWGDIPHDREKTARVAASLGLYSTSGVPGCQFNQAHEALAYTLDGICALRVLPRGPWQVHRIVHDRGPEGITTRWEPEPSQPGFATPAQARRAMLCCLDPAMRELPDEHLAAHWRQQVQNVGHYKLIRVSPSAQCTSSR